MRLAIVQPYVPTYRVALFERISATLRSHGIYADVLAPRPNGAQAARGDDAEGQSWHVSTGKIRQIQIRGASATSLGALARLGSYDAAIVPASSTVLDSQWAVWFWRRGRRRVGLWGHIGSFVGPANSLDLAIERAMMRSADHIFAYTARGTRVAIDAGVPGDAVTTLNNTLDTSELTRLYDELLDDEVEEFRRRHNLIDGQTFAFIGGLDSSKRIDFLASALDRLSAMQPTAHVLIAGSGVDGYLLRDAVSRGQVSLLGYADTRTKALIGRTASALLNPGRIGLLAVEALVLRLPIITTPYLFHAPEYDYLEPGIDVIVTPDDPGAYMEAAVDFATRPRPSRAATAPTLSAMVDSFCQGVDRMLAR